MILARLPFKRIMPQRSANIPDGGHHFLEVTTDLFCFYAYNIHAGKPAGAGSLINGVTMETGNYKPQQHEETFT